MEFIPSIKLDQCSVGAADPERSATLEHERLIALSSWMVILGTIRAVCTFADLVSALLAAVRIEPVSWRMLSGYMEENQPLLAVGVVWPLLLAVMLRRTRWRELVPAAGVTFLFLSTSGVLEGVTEWKYANGRMITLGSFHLSRLAFVKPTAPDVILGLLGAGQLLIEAGIGLRCFVLILQLRRSSIPAQELSKPEEARRARLGRLAIYLSFGFLILMIRLPVWSTYLELINESNVVREFVLKTNIGPPSRQRRPRFVPSKDDALMRQMQVSLMTASNALRSQNYLLAKEQYLNLIAKSETVENKKRPPEHDAIVANAHNDLAWLLATCPMTGMRDSRNAVKYARAAVEIEPTSGNYWNTLGVALYRNGELDTACEAFYKSMGIRGGGGDSFDWFFLAMIDQKQGRQQQARDMYQKAVKWYDTHVSMNDEELFRFQTEAAEVLGLPRPTEQPRARLITPNALPVLPKVGPRKFPRPFPPNSAGRPSDPTR